MTTPRDPMTEMEPCPVCDCASCTVLERWGGFVVVCGDCGEEGAPCDTEQGARDAWNRRTPAPVAQRDCHHGDAFDANDCTMCAPAPVDVEVGERRSVVYDAIVSAIHAEDAEPHIETAMSAYDALARSLSAMRGELRLERELHSHACHECARATSELTSLREQVAALSANDGRLREALDCCETEFIYLAKRTAKFSFEERCRFSALAVQARAALSQSLPAQATAGGDAALSGSTSQGEK